jgi:S-formylglutathione hydrolase FrmB
MPLLLTLLVFAMSAIFNSVMAGRVDTTEIFSVSMRKNIRCVIITPNNYSFQGERYPVLYLLHGWSGNYAGWMTDAPQIVEHADTYQMIIVCPDGGYDSWYLDSPVDSSVRYETHIVQEVTGYVDYYYHTRRDRAGRAIAGLSMGGHGALSLAVRHQGIFGAAGSMCGGVDLRPFKKNDWDLKGVLGNPGGDAWKNWENFSVINLIDQYKIEALPLIIDCGYDDFFLEVNRALHEKLLKADIPHEYTERPGEHNRDYWGNAVDFQILFFDKFFRGG